MEQPVTAATATTPKVSVVIPIYNVEPYLRECLDSIVHQTLTEIEIICVDDGSTDGCPAICEAYAAQDPRIKVIHQANQGAGGARNSGMAIATGEYIGFVDADDWIDLNFYELLYNKAKATNSDLVRTGYLHVYDTYTKEEGLNKLLVTKAQTGQTLNVNDHSVVVWNALYRLTLLRKHKINYVTAFRKVNDVLFTAMATYYATKAVPVVGTYYYYRRNKPNQLTVFDLQRFEYVIQANQLTIRFINSVDYVTLNDYLVAYKRCIWRYDDNFKRGLQLARFPRRQQKQLFTAMAAAIDNCRYKTEFLRKYAQEPYLPYLVAHDFAGYCRLYSRSALAATPHPLHWWRRLFTVTHQYDTGHHYKLITLCGIHFKIRG